MLRSLEREEPHANGASLAELRSNEPIVPSVERGEFDTSLLPRDHPRWVRDALTVSARTKALIATLKPVAVRVLGFWDHRIRSVVVGSLRVGIDASGSYRLQ